MFLLGRFYDARETLAHADGGALAHYYMAKSLFQLEQYDESIAEYSRAADAGYDRDDCNIGIAEVHRYAGRLQESMNLLDNIFGPAEQTAEYRYQRGATVAAIGGKDEEVLALYNRALQIDDHHPGALFGLALESDRAAATWKPLVCTNAVLRVSLPTSAR